ncbi:unnamed protein product, partial [Thlaspi arvense]
SKVEEIRILHLNPKSTKLYLLLALKWRNLSVPVQNAISLPNSFSSATAKDGRKGQFFTFCYLNHKTDFVLFLCTARWASAFTTHLPLASFAFFDIEPTKSWPKIK